VIDNQELYRRMLANLARFYRLMGERSPLCSLFERDGLVACVCPPAANRSFFNGVVYTDPGVLSAALDDLAAAYDEAGVRAWTVWVPEEDEAAGGALRAAGSVLDAAPRAMMAPLEEIDVGDGAGDVDWRPVEDPDEVAPLAGPAFGMEPEVTAAASRGLRGELRLYMARVDGRDAACVGTLDVERDCGVYMVATDPAFRGRGLATALMRQALLEARERGLQTTSLQATAMGAPIYARLGYRDCGAIQMWERRRASG
jgi:GNAT superfamily N-acetyltransferase